MFSRLLYAFLLLSLWHVESAETGVGLLASVTAEALEGLYQNLLPYGTKIALSTPIPDVVYPVPLLGLTISTYDVRLTTLDVDSTEFDVSPKGLSVNIEQASASATGLYTAFGDDKKALNVSMVLSVKLLNILFEASKGHPKISTQLNCVPGDVDIDLDLNDGLLEFAAGLFKGFIKDQIRKGICTALIQKLLPPLNEVLADVPMAYPLSNKTLPGLSLDLSLRGKVMHSTTSVTMPAIGTFFDNRGPTFPPMEPTITQVIEQQPPARMVSGYASTYTMDTLLWSLFQTGIAPMPYKITDDVLNGMVKLDTCTILKPLAPQACEKYPDQALAITLSLANPIQTFANHMNLTAASDLLFTFSLNATGKTLMVISMHAGIQFDYTLKRSPMGTHVHVAPKLLGARLDLVSTDIGRVDISKANVPFKVALRATLLPWVEQEYGHATISEEPFPIYKNVGLQMRDVLIGPALCDKKGKCDDGYVYVAANFKVVTDMPPRRGPILTNRFAKFLQASSRKLVHHLAMAFMA